MSTAFAEIAIRLPRNSCLRFGHRLNRNSRLPQQVVIAPAGHRIAAAIDDRGALDIIDRRDASLPGLFNGPGKLRGLGFVAENCDDRRGV